MAKRKYQNAVEARRANSKQRRDKERHEREEWEMMLAARQPKPYVAPAVVKLSDAEARRIYREEKRRAVDRRKAQLAQAAERLHLAEQRGNPYRRRTDPLRRTGMLDKQYDPADALWRSLQPYHGEQKPR